MLFGGLQKNTLIDFPAKIACVFFASGCNFDCPYCHNPELAKGTVISDEVFDENRAYDFLEKRKGFLDGVVISGGEPTLQPDVAAVCRTIRQMGYPVKIDTNGSRPQVLKQLIDQELIDYIAMDIKADPAEYPPVIAKNIPPENILESIRLIMDSGLDYEFKTTCVRPLVDAGVVEAICRTIHGARRYALQEFQNTGVLHPEFFIAHPVQYSKNDLEKFQAIARPWVKECLVR